MATSSVPTVLSALTSNELPEFSSALSTPIAGRSEQAAPHTTATILRLKLPQSPRLYQVSFDTLALLVSFVLYYVVRFRTGWFTTVNEAFVPQTLEDLIAIGAATVALYGYWLFVFWTSGLYENWYARSPFDECFSAIRVTFIGCCLLGMAILLDDAGTAAQNSRLIVFLYWVELSACICAGRIGARLLQQAFRTRGLIQIPALLVGSAHNVRDLLNNVRASPSLGYKPLAVVMHDAQEMEQWNTFGVELPAVGTFAEFAATVDALAPHEVLMSVATPNHEEMLHIGAECDARGIRMKIVPDLYEIFSGQARASHIYGMPLIEVSQQLMKPWEEAMKRTMDVVCSALGLLVGLPVWIAVGLAVRLESPGPALYSQDRIGKNNKRFRIYKFRSMRTDAEKDGPKWATKNDSRVTRVGRFIRKTHLDETPQLWNILKGDMSIVGPRPEMVHFVEKYSALIPYYNRRHKVRPGLTGWYQVHYSEQQETIEYVKERLRLDFFYIENMSFKFDVEICWRTVVRILRGSGTA